MEEQVWNHSNHLSESCGLSQGASVAVGLLAVVPAAIAMASEEWADAASKVATLVTAVAVAIVALAQAAISYSVYVDYQPAAANTGPTSDDQTLHKLPRFRADRPTILINEVTYYQAAYIFRKGRYVLSKLVRMSNGTVTVVGVQRSEEVCICKATMDEILEIDKFVR